MNKRTALLCLLAAASLAARAFAQDDVDELKKRYKNMPGGDIIAAQLEAHRAEIQAAMNKQHAQLQRRGLTGASKPADLILGMIPPPPKTLAQAAARLGKVQDIDGRQNDGDLKSAAARRETGKFLLARQMDALGGGPAGAVPPGQGPAIGKLGDDTQRLSQAEQSEQAKFGRAGVEDENALKKKLQELYASYRKSFDAARCLDVGQGAGPDTAQCDAIDKRYHAAGRKERQEYLLKRDKASAALRAKAARWLAEGTALEARSRKVITAPALAHPAAVYYQQLRSAEALVLQALIAANDAAVVNASTPELRIWKD